jgi:hypothetical protein
MSVRSLIHTALALLPLVAAPVAASQLADIGPQVEDDRVLAGFSAAINEYVALHHRVERLLPPERTFDDPRELFATQDALRAAIVKGRPYARQGDVFSPDVARLLIDRLHRVIVDQGDNAADILADIDRERHPHAPTPRVNHRYPWSIGSAMWPTLLAVLPALPAELEYRFAHRDLVLIDVHASLVVDILEAALPPAHDEYVRGGGGTWPRFEARVARTAADDRRDIFRNESE